MEQLEDHHLSSTEVSSDISALASLTQLTRLGHGCHGCSGAGGRGRRRTRAMSCMMATLRPAHRVLMTQSRWRARLQKSGWHARTERVDHGAGLPKRHRHRPRVVMDIGPRNIWSCKRRGHLLVCEICLRCEQFVQLEDKKPNVNQYHPKHLVKPTMLININQ